MSTNQVMTPIRKLIWEHFDVLTERQKVAYALAITGHNANEIAKKMNLSVKAVEGNLHAVYKKTKFRDCRSLQAALIKKALSNEGN